MADELEAVRQEFIADAADYIDEVQKAADSATELAASADKAKTATADLRAKVEEAARAIGIMRDEEDRLRNKEGEVITATEAQAAAMKHLRDQALEAQFAEYDLEKHTGGLRDKMLEAARALKITRDEEGRLRDSAGEVITAVEAEARALKHLRDEAAEAAFAMRELDKYQEKGFLSKLGGLFGGGGLGGLLAKAGQGSGLGGVPGGMYGTLGVLGAVGSVLPVLGMLLTGLTAAGAGLGSFAAVAIPNYTAASKAAQQVQTAQDNYNVSVAHGVKQATAYKAEQIAIGKAYVEMSPAQIALSKQIGNVQNAWQSFVQANTAGVSKILTQGIGLLPGIFKIMQQFIGPTETALSGILTMISQGMASPGFKQFTSFLASLAGPVLTTIGQGIIGLLPQLAQLMELFSKKDVVSAFKDTFRALGFALWLLVETIKQTMVAFDLLTKGLHQIADAFDHARHTVADFAHNVAAHFDEMRRDVASWAHDIAHWFDDVRHWVAGLGHDFAVWFDRIRHTIASWADDVVHFFQQLPGRILSALGNLGSLLWNAGLSLINGLISGIEAAVPGLHSVLSWVSSLIPSWKGPLEADAVMLVPHGAAIMQGLIRGLASQVPALHGMLAGIGGSIPGALGSVTRGGSLALAGSRVNVTVPVTLMPGTQGYNDPRLLQAIQQAVQEAVLRYNTLNPSNGLAIPGGRL